MLKPLVRTCAALALAAPLLTACMTANVPEDAFFYPEARIAAEKIVLEPGAAMPATAETLSLPYPGGAVAATRVRTGRADAPLILFCGGNMFRRPVYGGNAAQKLAPFGDVLMFDYPGYGDTPGAADYATFHAAGAAVAVSARAQADAEGRRLIAWGHSLGGPVCAEAARAARADALVLEATTPSARAAVNDMIGWKRVFVRVRLAPALAAIDVPATLAGYPGKVVVLEAGRDSTLPPALSRTLARDLQARGVAVERLVFPQADHNGIGRQPDFQPRLTAALAP
jgi:pimeloyl-ACP methyl ester carboxylesterase